MNHRNKSTGAGLVKTGENGATIPVPSTRMAVKQQARTRNWFQQCKKMTYLTLDDLPLEDKPRMTRNNAVTPFSLELERVEGWKVCATYFVCTLLGFPHMFFDFLVF